MKQINRLVRKIHIYAGLLTFSHLMIFGIAGLVATSHSGPVRLRVTRSVRFVPFAVPASSTDKQVADLVYRNVNLPLTRPVTERMLRRTPDNHLLLDFYNINGIYRVVVLENEGKLRIEDIPKGGWYFLEDIHAATLGDRQAPGLMRAWAFWNEAAMWSLLGFCVSGAFLWLTSRPRFWWAWASLAGGAVSFALLWSVFR